MQPRNNLRHWPAFLLLLVPFLMAQEPGPREESIGGRRYVVRFERNLWEGRATIVVTAFRIAEDKVRVHVNVKHVMYRSNGNGAIDALYCLDHGVKVHVEYSGSAAANSGGKEGDGGSMERETLSSSSTAAVDVDLKPVDGARDLRSSLRIDMRIFEPNLSSRQFTTIIDLEKLKMAECRDGFSSDKEIMAKLARLERNREEFRRKLQEAWRLKEELETALMRCEGELDNASYFLEAAKSIEESFDNAFKEAKYFEDLCGIAELAVGVGKAGVKMLTKHSETVLKALRGRPKHFVGFKRMLSALGEEATPAIMRAAKEMDELRVHAAKEVLEEMRKGVGLKKGMRNLEEGEAILSGSVIERFGPAGVDSPNWKGLSSDIDIEFPNKDFAEHFQSQFTKKVNDLLHGRGFGVVDEAGDLSVNTFVGNLGRYDVTKAEQFEEWVKRLLDSDYIANPDAYRTVGGQKSAIYYGKDKLDVIMEPIDGFEIVKEMASRADIFWKTKNYLDPKVFKDVRKCYERALVGEAIRKGTITRMNKNVPDLEQLIERVKHADPLYEKAAAVGQGAFDREIAEEMMRKIRQMDDGLSAAPEVASELRRNATDASLAVLRADRDGVVKGIVFYANERAALQAGLKEAVRQRAREIRIPEWIAWASSDVPSAIWAAAGLVEEIAGNPLTSAVKGWGKLFAWDSPPEDQVKSARESMGKAVEALFDPAARGDAERYWKKLRSAVDDLHPEEIDKLRREIDDMLREIEEHRRFCFELLATDPVNDMAEDYAELSAFVARVKQIQETFTREEMLNQAREEMGMAEIEAKADEARKEYEAMKPEIDRLNEIDKNLERKTNEMRARQVRFNQAMMDPEDPATKKAEEELRVGWEGLKAEIEEAKALRPRVENVTDAFESARARKDSAAETLDRLRLALPVSLHFRPIAQSILDRALANERGNFSAKELKGFCNAMRRTIRGIRCGDGEYLSKMR